jgi:hypothetical protein
MSAVSRGNAGQGNAYIYDNISVSQVCRVDIYFFGKVYTYMYVTYNAFKI